MMIGVHKLGFNDHKFEPNNIFNTADKNGMFTEVNLLMNAFFWEGHNIEYVDVDSGKSYDIIIVFNGHEDYTSNLKRLKAMCKELNYLLTDSAFYEGRIGSEYVDNYFVQSNVKMFNKPTFNSQLHKLPVYETNFYNSMHMARKDRDNKMIFGGSVKARELKVLEYIIRPETNFYLRYDELGLDTRVQINMYKNKLKRHEYGIVLINPKDVHIGNITWRYFEYIVNGVLTFVDRESDPHELIMANDDFMKVSSYKEMVMKQQTLELNPAFRNTILNIQQARINNKDYNGKTFVESLLTERVENKFVR